MPPKIRIDSKLAKLSDDQQAQLYDWLLTLGYTETILKVAEPPPNGFQLKTHRASLHRFFRNYARIVRAEDLAVATQNNAAPEKAPLLVSEAEQTYQHAAYQLATSPMNSDEFRQIGRWLRSHKQEELKLQSLDLASRQVALGEKRLAFDQYRFQMQTARLALQHIAALQRIHRDPTLHDDSKIRAACDELFRADAAETNGCQRPHEFDSDESSIPAARRNAPTKTT